MNIQQEPLFSEKDKAFIIEKLDTFGEHFGIPKREHDPIYISVRNNDGVLKGALMGYMYWKWLYIEFLWIDPELRGQGYGSALLTEAETWARAKGCIGAHLETHDFQAPQFYIHHGYGIVGTIKDLPPGHERYDMVKLFDS